MRIEPKRTQRFYYPAGAISLILLPVICICYFRNHQAFKQLGIMKVLFWDPVPGDHCMSFNPDAYYTSLDYTDFELTGNDRQDQMQLEAARMGVRNLVRSKDTLTGIHFHFDDRAAFWTLIKAFENMQDRKFKSLVAVRKRSMGF